MLMLIGSKQLPFEESPELWDKIEEPQARRLVQHMLKRNPLDRWPVSSIMSNAYFSSAPDTITEPPTGKGHTGTLMKLGQSILDSGNTLVQVWEHPLHSICLQSST